MVAYIGPYVLYIKCALSLSISFSYAYYARSWVAKDVLILPLNNTPSSLESVQIRLSPFSPPVFSYRSNNLFVLAINF